MKASSDFKPSSIFHNNRAFACNAGSWNKSSHPGNCPSTQVHFLPEVGWLSDPQREAGSLQEQLCGELFFGKGHQVCFWFGFSVSWSHSFEPREQSLANCCSSIKPVLDPHFAFFQCVELSQLSWTFPRFTAGGRGGGVFESQETSHSLLLNSCFQRPVILTPTHAWK